MRTCWSTSWACCKTPTWRWGSVTLQGGSWPSLPPDQKPGPWATSSSAPYWSSWYVCWSSRQSNSCSAPLNRDFLSWQHTSILTWTQIEREMVSYRWDRCTHEHKFSPVSINSVVGTTIQEPNQANKISEVLTRNISSCWHFRSFHPFCPLLQTHQPSGVQLWAVWAIHLVCRQNSKTHWRLWWRTAVTGCLTD